ncbi:hypothetical protein D3C75_418150 [compost metagenome]
MDALHVGDHAIHCHITCQHRFQLAVLYHRYGKGDHQFFGAGIDIRGGDHRATFFGGLLIPRAYGRIVIVRHPGRLREFCRFAGIANVDVNKPARLRQLFKHRHRIVAQGHALQGVDHHHLAVDPVADRQTVAGAGAGQHIALRLLVVLARYLEINDGIKKKGDDQTTDCRRDNTSAN